MQNGFRIRLSDNPDGDQGATITVHGSLVGEEVVAEFRRALDAVGQRRLKIDLRECDELDPQVISALAARAAAQRDDTILITGARGHVRRELLLAGVRQSSLFELRD